jgi:ribonuclease Y
MTLASALPAIIAALLGACVGYWFNHTSKKNQTDAIDAKIQEKLTSAREKIQNLKEESEKELTERNGHIIELEKIISERETKLDTKLESIEQKETELANLGTQLESEKQQYETLKEEEQQRIIEISGLTGKQAEERVLQLAEDRTKEEIVRRVRKIEQEGEHTLEEKARDILSLVIQRYASSHVAENSTSYVDVSDPSMIGRIIGKEGRNIQQLERVTGCEIVIDETPNSIMISGFSPVRRQVAKKAIESLIKDGRVHPGRIEDAVEEAKKKINDDIREAGEAVVFRHP